MRFLEPLAQSVLAFGLVVVVGAVIHARSITRRRFDRGRGSEPDR